MKKNLFQANSGQEQQQQRRPAHKLSATCAAALQTHLACCLLSQTRDPLGLLAHPHCHLLRHPPPSPSSHISMDSFSWSQQSKAERECLLSAGCCRWFEAQLAAGAGRALTHQAAKTTRDGRRASRKFVIRKSSQDAAAEDHLVITTERRSMGIYQAVALWLHSRRFNSLVGFQPFGQT